MEEKTNVALGFAAIQKKIVENIPKLTQEEARNKDYIYYGQDNMYPEYLLGLYEDVTTLKTIIDGTADYILGDDVMCNIPGMEKQVNRRGDTARDIIKWLSKDYMLYGGCAYEVIRNKKGNPAEIYYVDFRYLRTNKKNEAFWYSEEFGKKYARTTKTIVLPKFMVDSDAETSIVYIKNTYSTPYPIPRYSGAIKACEIERNIDEMHLSALQNGFMSSYIINMNGGVPTDAQKAEIEKNVNEKFCGTSNAGRIMLNFATSKDNMATVQKLDATDFSDKYTAAAERSREQIYCAFQAIPMLFGLVTETNGFSDIEFQTAFNLYNGTVIRPIQRTIIDSFDKVFNMKSSITIVPFSMPKNNEETTEVVN